jgi:hypothetical protein
MGPAIHSAVFFFAYPSNVVSIFIKFSTKKYEDRSGADFEEVIVCTIIFFIFENYKSLQGDVKETNYKNFQEGLGVKWLATIEEPQTALGT